MLTIPVTATALLLFRFIVLLLCSVLIVQSTWPVVRIDGTISRTIATQSYSLDDLVLL